MFNKIIIFLTISSLIFYSLGCSSKYFTTVDELKLNPKYKIAMVVTNDGTIYEFNSTMKSNAYLRNNTIEGITKKRIRVEIPISEVKTLYVWKISRAKTTFGVIISLVALSLIMSAIQSSTDTDHPEPLEDSEIYSCPFVYSFDGDQYIFDAEPYSGAISEGLQRTDICRLENLEPVDGEYRLLLTNEFDETQYTDEFKLQVVDHPAGVEVIPDAGGNLHTVKDPLKPLTVEDKNGNSVYKWVSEKDYLLWESDLNTKDPDNSSDLRDTLLFTFPKPDDAKNAKLVVNSGSALWGSSMPKKLLELMGTYSEEWKESLLTKVGRDSLTLWQRREGVYRLQVKVWSNNTWTTRGEIKGEGPFKVEDRIVPLDLSGVEGDNVKILLAPPSGFWLINSLALDYSQDIPVEINEISAKTMVGHSGADLRDILESTDGSYYITPEIGQTAELTFPVPELKQGYERTVFAKVSGYYDIHFDATNPPDIVQLLKILSEPGYFVRYALKDYHKWIEQHVSKSEKQK
ncbi:hypothetical protein ACFL6G_01705 [candidate division KSB1 bacterium]